MALYLGIDTSNYTTSAALYDGDTGEITQQKQPIPVKEGAVGQRQSDAVFAHVKQLGGLLGHLLRDAGTVAAVGVSVTPRDEAGSYMPCFLAGEMAAASIAAATRIPRYPFSHQAGHVAAALYGSERIDLLRREFLAFHVSGGTTQCLYVSPRENIFSIEMVSQSLDLHAGQVVDRVGAMLGLSFPAGPELERLAARSEQDYSPKPAMKGADCCLSGLENLCRKLLADGGEAPDVAKFCLCYLRETLLAMTGAALERHPGLPLVYAGGVMSNRFLRKAIQSRYGGSFAPPAYSADNAAGIALLCHLKEEGAPICSP